jgi:hypothetical protein
LTDQKYAIRNPTAMNRLARINIIIALISAQKYFQEEKFDMIMVRGKYDLCHDMKKILSKAKEKFLIIHGIFILSIILCQNIK